MLIAVDLDEILAGFLDAFILFYNEKYNANLNRDNFHTYKYWEVLKCTRDESIRTVYEFYKTPHFKNIKAIDGSIEGINELNREHELIIITGRPNYVKKETEKWIESHFSNKFSEVYLTNLFSLNGSFVTKTEICKDMKTSIAIEDDFEHAKDYSSNNIKVLLKKYKWNENKDLPHNVEYVNNWEDIIKKIII